MRDPCEDFRTDPIKGAACERLEKLGAAIGAIDDDTVHVELKPGWKATPIGDSDLAGVVDDVNTLGNVGTLDLSETAITDKSIAEIKRLTTVTALYLTSVNITDEALGNIAAISTLKEVALTGPGVTEDGVAALQEQVPDLAINYEE
jgi:hypothetical protein